ncbi:MAG: rRNA pseudouridine synthase [Pseudorhodobacter sp.]|nr:rRNA pseudouridine synthase [Pseudorhodobacter sp.]
MAEKTKPAPKKTHEGERIAKVLSRAGVASRREAERMIEVGDVAVNGKVITSPALNVTPRDQITINGILLAEPEPPRLWLYYKPDGLVSSNSDEKGRDTVFDNLPDDLPRVMSVGRLDLNSEGLLLLTNDGELKRRLELPSTGWLRKYRVRVKGNPTDPDLEPLRRGITVDGEKFQSMSVVLDRIQGANAWLTVGIREGKNREIRRAMTAINLTVNRLIRVSYGPFRLGDLQPGQAEEIKGKVLREQLGTNPATEGEEKPVRRAVRTARPVTADAPKVRKPTTAVAGAGLKTLSQAWQKATRTPTGSPTGRASGAPSGTPKAAPKSTAGMTRLDAPYKGSGSRSKPRPKPTRNT